MENSDIKNQEPLNYRTRTYQSIPYALIGGFFSCILAASLYGLIANKFGSRFGTIALITGFIVGLGVRYFGAGRDPIFGVISGFYTTISCLLGGFFAIVLAKMNLEGIGLIDTLHMISFGLAFKHFRESIGIFQLIFITIAVYQGVKFSIIKPKVNSIQKDSIECFFKYREIVIGFLLFSFIVGLFYISSLEPTAITQYHTTGEKESFGMYTYGKKKGEWEYYYTNGQIEKKGVYENGKYSGMWSEYFINGELRSMTNFKEGVENGDCIAYYENGNIMTSWSSIEEELNGPYEHYFENGNLSVQTTYKNGLQHGITKRYDENGTLISEDRFVNGKKEM